MFLRSIRVQDFRNLEGEISWGNGTNVIYGNNGQGKTNWLEAVHFLAHAKSFRTNHSSEAITFGKTTANIRGRVAKSPEIERELEVTLRSNSKHLSINGKREPLARFASELPAVWFTAEELEVVRGGPEARRNFIDRGAVSLHPAYAQTVSDYNRVLKQKRILLQQHRDGSLPLNEAVELIEPWNRQMVRLSATIHGTRSAYVERLHHALEHSLFGETISIRYVSALEGKGDLADYQGLISDRLKLRLPAEIAAGMCLIGPHRDDLEINFGGRDLRSFGSSGQQRSALITLDLAAISVYYLTHQDYPIFLIDDVDAELDGRRIERLLDYLDGRTQTFVTTSKRNHFERFTRSAQFYEVSNGNATVECGVRAAVI